MGAGARALWLMVAVLGVTPGVTPAAAGPVTFYVLSNHSDELGRFDLGTMQAEALGPHGLTGAVGTLALDAHGRLFTNETFSNTVYRLDTQTGAPTLAYALDVPPQTGYLWGTAVRPDGMHLHTRSRFGDTPAIYVVDPVTGQEVEPLVPIAETVLAGSPRNILLRSDGNIVALDGIGDQLVVIDAHTGQDSLLRAWDPDDELRGMTSFGSRSFLLTQGRFNGPVRLHELDPFTGDTAVIGEITLPDGGASFNNLWGLAAIPAPGTLCVLGMGAALAARRRRRERTRGEPAQHTPRPA